MPPFLAMLMWALYRAGNPASFIWVLLVPTLRHRLLGPWLGSVVGGATMVGAGMMVAKYTGIGLSAETMSMILDVQMCSVALFLLSLVHEPQLQRADRRLRGRADLDPLAHLASRQRFREIAEQKREAARTGHRHAHCRVSMLMADIDFFKQVNDDYGHYVGDRVLETIAQRLLENCRAEDGLGRISG